MESIHFSWYLSILLTLIATIIITYYGYSIYSAIKSYNFKSLELKKNYEDLKSKQEKLLLETEIEIQEQTFQFISKEIHDNITQCLSLANLTLNCLDLSDETKALKELQKSKEQISKALNDLNNLSKSLDSDIIESHGLVLAIDFEIEKWSRIIENKIIFQTEGTPVISDNYKELFLFRIIQESINNIVKYADAKIIEIDLKYASSFIEISIKDDGIGFDLDSIYEQKKAGKMAGLKNMKKRAEALNGTLEIISKPNNGTTIYVKIPLHDYEKDNSRFSRRSQTTS